MLWLVDCILNSKNNVRPRRPDRLVTFRQRSALGRPLQAVCLAFGIVAATASAADLDNYPQRRVTMVVPSPAGGTTDVVARIVGKKLGEILGQPFIIRNRSGANGYIGTSEMLQAPKDGYTLIVMSGSLHSYTPSMVKSMPFDPIEDFALVSRLISYPFILVVGPKSPYNSLHDVIAAGKDGKTVLSYGSYGVGSSPHLITELLKLKTGIEMIHVPYAGGGQSSGNLIGGQISMMFSSLPAASIQVKSGLVKGLAITSATRHLSFPEVPTTAETIPGFEATSWLGLAAAKGTPDHVGETLRKALNEAVKDPAFVKQLKDLGADVRIDQSSKIFHDFLVAEKVKWDQVVKEANIPKQEQ